MVLPIDRTNLTAAQSNQVPNQVIQSAKNIAAISTLYDGNDELYSNFNTALAGVYNSDKFTQLGIINPKDSSFKASGSAQTTTGSITTGTALLNVSSVIDFAVGQGIAVAGAGVGGAALITKINSISGTALTLAANASTTVTGQTVQHSDDVAIQSAINAAYDGGRLPVMLPGGTYYISNKLQLSKGLAAVDPVSLIGSSTEAVTLKAGLGFPINTPMVEVFGGSGDVRKASVRNIRLNGNNVTGVIGVNNRGVDGFQVIDCYFENMKYGGQFSNTDGGNFTEISIFENCHFLSTVETAIRYYRTSATATANSFHGSGMINCQINQGSGYAITLQDDSGLANALVYNAPLDFGLWGTNKTIISTNSTLSMRTSGTIRLEGTGIILATGAGGVNHSGTVQSISAAPTFGTFTLSGQSEVSGLLKTYAHFIDEILFDQNTPGFQAYLRRKYAQGSSGVIVSGGTGDIDLDAGAGGYIRTYGAPSGDAFGGGVDIVAYSDNISSGTANVVRFKRRTGVNTVSESARFDPSGNFIIAGAWNTPHFILGTNHMWVDSVGKLRIKNGSPLTDTDGVVVGTQT